MGSLYRCSAKGQSCLTSGTEPFLHRARQPRLSSRNFRCQSALDDQSRSLTVNAVEDLRFRSVFISDIHLATNQSHAEALLSFLDKVETENLFLVGDIVDGWKIVSKWYWPASHTDVLLRILELARCGTSVVYIPGNHDEAMRLILRRESAVRFGDVVIVEEMKHRTADGRTFLVLHGDRCDRELCLGNKFKRAVGDWVYDRLIDANTAIKTVRQQLGMPYWSLAAHVKDKSKFAQKLVDQFESALAEEAERQGVDGVICGHIHKPEIRQIGNVLYCNDGDWVDSCTALVEDFDGSLRLLNWLDHPAASADSPAEEKDALDDESLIKQQGFLLNLGSQFKSKDRQEH
eukprot:jgi/Botrbrau1/11768/Bobra.0195s0093.1